MNNKDIPIMKITPFNNAVYSNLSTITRGEGIRNYMCSQSQLKGIRGNVCGCCGNQMLTHDDISRIWAKTTLPLKTILTNFRFEKIKQKFPDLYATLSYLANKFPKNSLSKIVLEKSNHITFMDSIAHSFEEENRYDFSSLYEYRATVKKRTIDILNMSACILKDAPEVISEVKPYEKYLRGRRLDIFKELEYQANKYPDKKLSEIIRIPELSEKYIENTYFEAMDFAKKRDYHWEKADNIILKSNSELKDAVKELRTQVALTYGGDDDKRVAYLVQELYRSFLKDNNLKHLEKDVMDEITQIPLCSFTKNSFLSYARRYYSDGMILQYIIRPSMETVKNIVPPQKGGGDEINNQYVVCRSCGDDLAQFPYTETAKYHTGLMKYVEKQLQLVGNKILEGSLPSDMFDYPIAASKTLYECSGGLINPNLSDYIAKLNKLNIK